MGKPKVTVKLSAHPEADGGKTLAFPFMKKKGSSDESVCTESVGACWYHEPSS